MSGESRADRRYRGREAGWYVVNPETRIAVAGPFVEREWAEREARHRNAHPPVAPCELEVEEVPRWMTRR